MKSLQCNCPMVDADILATRLFYPIKSVIFKQNSIPCLQIFKCYRRSQFQDVMVVTVPIITKHFINIWRVQV